MAKNASLSLLAVLLLIALSALSGGPSQAPSRAADKVLAAYYFYWYDIYSNLHFIDPDGSDALTDHPPDADLATYSYKEICWHRQQLLDMIAAGVDVVLPVY